MKQIGDIQGKVRCAWYGSAYLLQDFSCICSLVVSPENSVIENVYPLSNILTGFQNNLYFYVLICDAILIYS